MILTELKKNDVTMMIYRGLFLSLPFFCPLLKPTGAVLINHAVLQVTELLANLPLCIADNQRTNAHSHGYCHWARLTQIYSKSILARGSSLM